MGDDGLNRRATLAIAVGGIASLAVAPRAIAAENDRVRTWFEGYLTAFNGKDYSGFSAYYADDIKFHGQAATLVGRQAVVDFYTDVHKRLDEKVELIDLVGNDRLLAAEIRTTLVAREDWPDFPTGALKAGDRRGIIGFVFYNVENGRFTRIRSARYAKL